MRGKCQAPIRNSKASQGAGAAAAAGAKDHASSSGPTPQQPA
jgi:hypothetical protein